MEEILFWNILVFISYGMRAGPENTSCFSGEMLNLIYRNNKKEQIFFLMFIKIFLKFQYS